MHRSLSNPKGPHNPCLVVESLNEPPNTPQIICLLHGSRKAVKASILLDVLEITHSFPHPWGWQLEGGSAVLLHPLCSGHGGMGAACIPEGTADAVHRNSTLAELVGTVHCGEERDTSRSL